MQHTFYYTLREVKHGTRKQKQSLYVKSFTPTISQLIQSRTESLVFRASKGNVNYFKFGIKKILTQLCYQTTYKVAHRAEVVVALLCIAWWFCHALPYSAVAPRHSWLRRWITWREIGLEKKRKLA